MKAYLYCTKVKPYLAYSLNSEEWGLSSRKHNEFYDDVNGTVCFECEINKVEEIRYGLLTDCFTTNTLGEYSLLNRACLTEKQIKDYYLRYALYLENVKPIEPMNINYSNKIIKVEKEEDEYDWQEINNGDTIQVCFKKAPQNMCYAWVHNGKEWERCVLISVQPQHLRNIANGLKDIETRKSILNGLKELIK